jgi:shikimate kinase
MRWVVLTGYMGAGKSSVGRALAGQLGCAFVDSDQRIEADAGIDIPKIFATKGEVWFRRTEERTIRDIVSGEPAGVLAVGGGAIESARTRDFLRRTATVVWLDADTDVLWARVSGSTRPLATDATRFARRYARRRPAYAEAADVTVDAARPLDAVVADVAAAVATIGAGA